MITELPVLRARLGLSQEELGEKIGLSRQMVVAMETRKRPMTWNTYLSLILLFLHNRFPRLSFCGCLASIPMNCGNFWMLIPRDVRETVWLSNRRRGVV